MGTREGLGTGRPTPFEAGQVPKGALRVRLAHPPPWKRRQLACHSALNAADPVINWGAGSIPASSSKMKDLEFAPDDRVGFLQSWIDQIMRVVCPEYLYISDLSMIGDFEVDEEDMPMLQAELGVPVKLDDLVVDVAQRLKNKFG